jgi:hypothetical protein
MPKKMLKYEESLMLAGELVPINITLTRRRSFAIIVRTDKTVEVKAPLKSNISQLLKKTADRGEWILKNRKRFEALPTPSKKQYVNGEEFGYLGKKYKLNAIKASLAKVELSGDYINVHSKTASPAAANICAAFANLPAALRPAKTTASKRDGNQTHAPPLGQLRHKPHNNPKPRANCRAARMY